MVVVGWWWWWFLSLSLWFWDGGEVGPGAAELASAPALSRTPFCGASSSGAASAALLLHQETLNPFGTAADHVLLLMHTFMSHMTHQRSRLLLSNSIST